MEYVWNTLQNLGAQTAFANLYWGNFVMILVACVFLVLAIKFEFEPLLLVPISFGMLLANMFPGIIAEGGLLEYITIPDFLGGRCDDGFWTVDCKSEEFLIRCSGTVWYLFCIFLRNPYGI